MRYNWVVVRFEIDEQEMRELVEEAWAMCVPKGVAARYFERIIPPDEPRSP